MNRRPAALLVWLLVAALTQSAHAAESAAPAGVSVALELVRSLGLPTALLLLVWWDQRRERARQEAARALVLAEHARDRAAWETELKRLNEARHQELVELSTAHIESRAENTAALRAHTAAIEAGDHCPARAEYLMRQQQRRP